MSYIVKCPECGKDELHTIHSRIKLCDQCQHKEKIARQWQRRRRKAGLLTVQKSGSLRYPVPVKRNCQHCGQAFTPERTTARFCSPKCRVYFHRATPPRRAIDQETA
jgi:hypothetical protein